MDLLLVRHGETLSNSRKIYAGRSSEELTEKGVLQAAKVANKLKQYDIYALYSSPIKRAVQTAEIIGKTLGKNYSIMNDFKEMMLGPWEGLSESEIASNYPREWKLWQGKPAELRLPGRESLDELLKRALKGINKISYLADERMIVIVTHVAIIRTLLLWRLNKSMNLYKTIDVPNAKIFNIQIKSSPPL